jgi:hypothetical protein
LPAAFFSGFLQGLVDSAHLLFFNPCRKIYALLARDLSYLAAILALNPFRGPPTS